MKKARYLKDELKDLARLVKRMGKEKQPIVNFKWEIKWENELPHKAKQK